MKKLQFYSVRAHSGRYNGEALFLTTSKKEAKKLAQNYWLDLGVVDLIRTVKQVVEEEDSIYTIEDDYQYYMDMLIKEGDWVEIEWGT